MLFKTFKLSNVLLNVTQCDKGWNEKKSAPVRFVPFAWIVIDEYPIVASTTNDNIAMEIISRKIARSKLWSRNFGLALRDRDRKVSLLHDSFQSPGGSPDFLLDQARLLSICRAQTTSRILFLMNLSPLGLQEILARGCSRRLRAAN